MDRLPAELVSFLQALRPLFRAEVFVSFGYLMAGILRGEAKSGTVRARVFARAGSWPPRLSELFCRHQRAPQGFLAALTALAWQSLYPGSRPIRLLWMADATSAENPYSQRIASRGRLHRTKRVVGQARHLRGPG